MSDTVNNSLSPRLARTATYAYFAVVALVGISPSKGFSIAARVVLCLSIAYAYFLGSYDFASWISTKRKVRLFCLLQLLGWLMLIPVEFYSFEYNNFDTGIFANNITQWRETGRYYSSIFGMHAFGDHFTPNLILFAPLFSLWKSFLWLPIVKVLAWAWSIYLLIRFSQDVLGESSRFQYLVPGIYLLNQFVANTLLMEFQPSCLTIPLIVLAFRLAYKEKIVSLTAVLLVILGFKEHLGVIWISLGLFLMLEKRKPLLGLTLLTLGTFEGLLVYQWLMPLFAGGEVHHNARIGPFTGIPKKMTLLMTAIISFGGLPVLARYGLIYSLPGFVLVLMGVDPSMQSFDHHYHDIGFILLACSSILGLRSLQNRDYVGIFTPQRIANCVVLLVLSQAIRFPTFYIQREWPSREQIAMHSDLAKIKLYIADYSPQEIWTLDHLGPYFSELPNLKSISKPELPTPPAESARRVIVISPIVKSYPLLPSEYQRLESYLKAHYMDVTTSARITAEVRVFVSKGTKL